MTMFLFIFPQPVCTWYGSHVQIGNTWQTKRIIFTRHILNNWFNFIVHCYIWLQHSVSSKIGHYIWIPRVAASVGHKSFRWKPFCRHINRIFCYLLFILHRYQIAGHCSSNMDDQLIYFSEGTKQQIPSSVSRFYLMVRHASVIQDTWQKYNWFDGSNTCSYYIIASTFELANPTSFMPAQKAIIPFEQFIARLDM